MESECHQINPSAVAAPDRPTLWTTKECAAYLRKSTRWLWREIARGNVPHVRVGKSPRFYSDEIDAWVRNGCRFPAASASRNFTKN